MWDKKPTAEEISKWFSGFKLHEGLEHSQYVNGIVAIENRSRGQSIGWSPFVTATTRIKYFWDLCEVKGWYGSISNPRPIERPFGFAPDKIATGLLAEVNVSIWETSEIDPDQPRRPLRSATGRKQVDQGYLYSQVRNPDFDAIMKAETGALARGLGQIGILCLPGSGVATAEDMNEVIGREHVSAGPISAQSKKQTKKAPDPRAS